MADGMEADLKTLRADFAQLKADFAKLAGSLQQLVDHGRQQGADGARMAFGRVEAGLKDGADELAKRVQEQPFVAAATAFGVGLLLGLLSSGRRG
jgi:ElaB/YqjD/DUF883 family membrane-anchored ribosome-binding protein